jgi:hypothetical protein
MFRISKPTLATNSGEDLESVKGMAFPVSGGG